MLPVHQHCQCRPCCQCYDCHAINPMLSTLSMYQHCPCRPCCQCCIPCCRFKTILGQLVGTLTSMLHAWALWALAHDSGNGSGPVENTGRPSATSMDDAEVPGLIMTCGKPQTHCPNWQWTCGKPPVGFQLHLWMMQRPPNWQ